MGTHEGHTTKSPPLTKGEQTREAILHAAIERFGRNGFRSTSVADIARDAQVSGTLAYAYYDNKQGLFIAALDREIATVVSDAVTSVLETPGDDTWRTTLFATLLAGMDHHPLARRMLAGLEPNVTDRILELPAMDDLRTAVIGRIEADQAAGLARRDVDATAVGPGIIGIFVSSLMAAVQFGEDAVGMLGSDVLAVIAAALDPIGPQAR